MTKNFTKDKSGKCSKHPSPNAPDREHDFQLRSLWTDTYSVLVQIGPGKVQLVSKVLPFAYAHCKHCHWKELSCIIDTSTQIDSGDCSAKTKEEIGYTGVSDEKEAIRQMVETMRHRVGLLMKAVLGQS